MIEKKENKEPINVDDELQKKETNIRIKHKPLNKIKINKLNNFQYRYRLMKIIIKMIFQTRK